MNNSYGFNGIVPAEAVAGKYDIDNAEFTGLFFFTFDEAEEAEAAMDERYSAESVNGSDWVSRF